MKKFDGVSAAIIAIGLIFTVGFFARVGGEQYAQISNAMEALGAAMATLTLFMAARAFGFRDAVGRAWGLLGVGMFFNALAFAVYGVLGYPSAESEVFPTEADPLWVMAYPFLIAGALLIRKQYLDSGFELRKSRTVFAVTALLCVSVGWEFLLPILQNTEYTPYQRFILISYPVGDAILLATAYSILRVVSQFGMALAALPWIGLIAGFVSLACADLYYIFLNNKDAYTGGSLPDLLWTLQGILMAWGAWQQCRLMRES